MTKSFTYAGRELEAMNVAENYHRWILKVFQPYLGKHLVEVGAGIGSFAEMILANHKCETFSAVEPSKDIYDTLRSRISTHKTGARVTAYHGCFDQVAPLLKSSQPPDTAIYVNTLEHIANDRAELKTVHETLTQNGCLLLFVPALPWLHGSFDDLVGHYRRYKKRELEEKLVEAGFEVVASRYFDLVGIAPWWIKYRLLRSNNMEAGAVKFYDRFVVPAVRRIEAVVPPLIGKSIIAVGCKRNQDSRTT
jgi:SAM-dependent methyltransferase